MAEGARFPWKYQSTVVVPTLSYKDLSKPLQAPKGTRWHFDRATKEWVLVSDGTARTYSHSRGVDAPGCGDDDALIDATIIVDGQTVPNDGGDTATETFVEHIVEPSDTFQGICLRYKISATHLRQANGGFSGTNLSLAPNPLKIPNPPNKAGDYVKYVPEAARGGQTEELRDVIPTALTDGQVISLLQRQFVNMTSTEARAYMELSDWELDQAVQAAADDNFARSKVT